MFQLLPPQGNNPLPDSLVPNDSEKPAPSSLTSKELVVLRISYMARIMAIVDASANMDNPDYETNSTEVSAAALRLLLLDSQLNSVGVEIKQTEPRIQEKSPQVGSARED